MDFPISVNLNFNSAEHLPGFSACAIFKVNQSSVFKVNVDLVPTIINGMFSYYILCSDPERARSAR